MNSKECNECFGLGKINLGPCYRCSGNGVISDARFNYLVGTYWPKRVADGATSQHVADEKIAELRAWWEGKPPVQKFEPVVGEDDLLAI